MIDSLRQQLLYWYDHSGRSLPWRARSPQVPDPYHVWLSEIMLQQTTVATVIPYHARFLSLWPRLENLAGASLEEIRVAWQGLGYYSRARNLHACARLVMEIHGGIFPEKSDDLIRLPGIGPYTAAAVASIAFNEAVVPVDGNILRVMSRIFRVEEALPDGKNILSQHASRFASTHRPGDFAQALMDLGATICTPRKPKCDTCPIRDFCEAFRTDQPERFPLRKARAQKTIKYMQAFVYINKNNEVALRRRPERGLLAGLPEVPSTPWSIEKPRQIRDHPVWIRHVFTHIDLHAEIIRMGEDENPPEDCVFVALERLGELPLPTLTQKIIAAALGDQ